MYLSGKSTRGTGQATCSAQALNLRATLKLFSPLRVSVREAALPAGKPNSGQCEVTFTRATITEFPSNDYKSSSLHTVRETMSVSISLTVIQAPPIPIMNNRRDTM